MIYSYTRLRYQVSVYRTIGPLVTFMNMINFMLSCVEHEKSFITSGPHPASSCMQTLS